MRTTYEQALKIVLSTAKESEIESISLEDSTNRILREDILADRDFPPFDRVAMDGIAINYKHFNHQSRAASIDGIAAAGSPKQELNDLSGCFEVMTGAVLPDGADSVIRYEDISIENGQATISNIEITEGQNVHKKGFDRTELDVLINKGRRLSPAEIGVCASVGKSTIEVSKPPKCIIVSSGNELVDVNQTPQAHQIRKSNVHQLASTLMAKGINPDLEHLQDEESVIEEKLNSFLSEYDVIIISGGVSKGKFDFIPNCLDRQGVEKLFHKVEQRPGKPFWFGKHPNGTVVFAFPGNPVSSFMCAMAYFIPWLDKSLATSDESLQTAVLAEDIMFKPDLTFFVQVKIESGLGKPIAIPVKGKGSGDLANLVDADGFLILPQGETKYTAGSEFQFIGYRNLI